MDVSARPRVALGACALIVDGMSTPRECPKSRRRWGALVACGLLLVVGTAAPVGATPADDALRPFVTIDLPGYVERGGKPLDLKVTLGELKEPKAKAPQLRPHLPRPDDEDQP